MTNCHDHLLYAFLTRGKSKGNVFVFVFLDLARLLLSDAILYFALLPTHQILSRYISEVFIMLYAKYEPYAYHFI